MNHSRREPSFGESTSFADLDASERDAALNVLKSEINAFLWTHLPRSVSIGTADDIALRWHAEIEQLWKPRGEL